MLEDPENKWIYLMDFVDAFRYYKGLSSIKYPVSVGKDSELEALLSSV